MQLYHFPRTLAMLVLIWGLLPVHHSMAEATIEILSPKESVLAGQTTRFHIQTLEIASPANAFLHHRTIGAESYQISPMERQTQNDFVAVLEDKLLLPPGLEYFFLVTDGRGRIFTHPDTDPQKNPLRMETSLNQFPTASVQAPPSRTTPTYGERIEDRRPLISISLADLADVAAVRLLVNGVDVTDLSSISTESVSYIPETDLDYGRHTIVLETADSAGRMHPSRSWSFSIPQSGAFDRATTSGRVDAELNRQIMSDGDESEWSIQSSATLSSVLERDRLRLTFDTNIWYLEEDGPRATGDAFNLNNYLLQLDYGEQLLALGDVSVEGTDLVSHSLARRGARASLNVLNTRIEAFVLSADPLTGFDDLTGIEDPDKRLAGGFIQRDLLGDERLVVRGTVVRGRNEDPDGYNTSSLAAGNRGRILSLSATGRVVPEKLHLVGEYAASRFDPDTSGNRGQRSDNAWLARLSGLSGIYSYDAGYRRLGPEFRSVVEPTGEYDREEFTAGGGILLDGSAVNLRVVHSRDNVEDDPLLPVIRNTTGALSYSLAKPEWPLLFANYSITQQRSFDEPVTFDGIKLIIQNAGVGLSIARERWNLTPSYNFTHIQDRGEATDEDSRTHVIAITAGLYPNAALSFSPSVAYSRLEADSSDTVTETWQGALGAAYAFNAAHTLNLTLSVQDNRVDDGSAHLTIYDAIGQHNWHLRTRFLGSLEKTLALRGRYQRTDDHENNDTEEDYSIALLFNLGFPFSLPR
jgi:hypothetical protein